MEESPFTLVAQTVAPGVGGTVFHMAIPEKIGRVGCGLPDASCSGSAGFQLGVTVDCSTVSSVVCRWVKVWVVLLQLNMLG